MEDQHSNEPSSPDSSSGELAKPATNGSHANGHNGASHSNGATTKVPGTVSLPASRKGAGSSVGSGGHPGAGGGSSSGGSSGAGPSSSGSGSAGAPSSPVEWLTPALWLAANMPLAPDSIKALAPNAPTELLIWALYHDRKTVEEMSKFIGDDIIVHIEPAATPPGGPPTAVGSSSRTDWFAQLSDEIKAVSGTYEEYLDSRWNPLLIEYGLPPDTYWKLNPLGMPVRYWGQHPIWYDPELLTFYCYEAETGLWKATHDQEVVRSVTEFLIPRALANETFLPSNETVAGIVKTLKALALKEPTYLKERPLHFANGMFFMSTKTMVHSFSPAYYSRNRVAINYSNMDTGITAFTRFLEDSLYDEDIEILQSWCGMLLLNQNPYHKIMFLTGKGGSGKSTFLDILDGIIGSENVGTLVVERLEDRFELGEFFGKSLLLAKDVNADFSKSKKVHMLKSLSGDKHIKAEIKFANKRIMLGGPFNIGMTCNETPKIHLQGDREAWERRLLMVQFDPDAVRAHRKGPPFKEIPKLAQQLVENESSGILHWMLAGAKRITNQMKIKGAGFPLPKDSTHKDRISKLLTASDEVASFVANKVKTSPKTTLTTSALYAAYEQFCAPLGEPPVEETVFARRICKHMMKVHKSEAITITGPSGVRSRGYQGVSF